MADKEAILKIAKAVVIAEQELGDLQDQIADLSDRATLAKEYLADKVAELDALLQCNGGCATSVDHSSPGVGTILEQSASDDKRTAREKVESLLSGAPGITWTLDSVRAAFCLESKKFRGGLSSVLSKMVSDGVVERVSRGVYKWRG